MGYRKVLNGERRKDFLEGEVKKTIKDNFEGILDNIYITHPVTLLNNTKIIATGPFTAYDMKIFIPNRLIKKK